VKPTICLDKPIIVGASILDLSKVLMYDFWYNTQKAKYENIQLCFTGENKQYLKNCVLVLLHTFIVQNVINLCHWPEKLIQFSHSDTESLLFRVQTEDLYRDMEEITDKLDTSNYEDCTLYSPTRTRQSLESLR
jgi:hypothetical protein